MSVITAGRAGRVPPSPAHEKKKTWILSLRQPPLQKQYTVFLHFAAGEKAHSVHVLPRRQNFGCLHLGSSTLLPMCFFPWLALLCVPSL